MLHMYRIVYYITQHILPKYDFTNISHIEKFLCYIQLTDITFDSDKSPGMPGMKLTLFTYIGYFAFFLQAQFLFLYFCLESTTKSWILFEKYWTE